MRTTIRLDDQLFKQAKRIAAETGRTFTEIVEDALRQSFSVREAGAPRKRIVLPVSKCSGGLRPGVNLDDSAGLLDIMEGIDAPTGR
jgi:hypothetical protein